MVEVQGTPTTATLNMMVETEAVEAEIRELTEIPLIEIRERRVSVAVVAQRRSIPPLPQVAGL